jgi:hypothetical protein
VANAFQTLTFITRETLRQVKSNLQFVRNCAGEEFTGRFTEAPRKGETIKVRKPTRFVGRDGELFTGEDYIERTVDMTVQTTAGVDIELSNRELMFSMEQLSDRVVNPAAMTLANKIDRAALRQAIEATANCVGTPGVVPTAMKTYNSARAKTSWEGAPQDGSHTQLLSPDMQVEIADAVKSQFHDAPAVKAAFRTGMLGSGAVGADWYECQNIVSHTVGALGGTPLTNGATADGANSVVTNGWTAAAANRLKRNDIITFTGVYAVNPWTRESIGALRQFVVTADVASDGSGNATIPISPSIIASGPFQNVTAVPASGAAILTFGAVSTYAGLATPQGLRFHKDAFLFGTFDQPNPNKAVEFVQQVSDPDTGIKIRFLRDWDTKANVQINRFDVVWAFGIAFPEFACRIAS